MGRSTQKINLFFFNKLDFIFFFLQIPDCHKQRLIQAVDVIS